MPSSKKPPYHHGDLRSALLEAAEAELCEQGIEAFSLRSVAKRAGVSHGAPAHHFSDANGLLTALAASGYDGLISMQTERQKNAKPDAISQMVALGLGYIDFAEQNPELFRLMFSSEKPDRSDKQFADVSIKAFNMLLSGAELVSEQHPFSDQNALHYLMASWSVVHGLAELIVSGRAERPIGFSQMNKKQRDQLVSSILLSVSYQA